MNPRPSSAACLCIDVVAAFPFVVRGLTIGFDEESTERDVLLVIVTLKLLPETFQEFRKGEGLEFRGVTYWTRKWKAHCIHCKHE